MGRKMKHAPVYFTIAQVRHNPIQLGRYAPDIQESLRKAGYPDFRQGKAVTINLAPPSTDGSPDVQEPPYSHVQRFTFLDRDGTRGFIVDQHALSFLTTEYDTFETFAAEFDKGLEIVHQHIMPDYSERVGLRYLDAIVPREGETELTKYLVPGVLGLAGGLPNGTNIALSMSETHIPTSNGNLLSRTIVRNGPLGFPSDLEPQGLRLPERFQQINGVHAIIDTDASYQSREAFDLENVRRRLALLHDTVWIAFDATVTPHAMQAWA